MSIRKETNRNIKFIFFIIPETIPVKKVKAFREFNREMLRVEKDSEI